MRYLLAIILLLCPVALSAATINAASGSWADCSNAVYTAVAGDTVVVPAGTNHWTNQLQILKGITFQGAGVVMDGLNTDSLPYITTNTVETRIIDDVAARGSVIWCVTTNYSHPIRVTGFRFEGDGLSASQGFVSLCSGTGSLSNGPAARLDTCVMANSANRMMSFYGYCCMVMDHCVSLNQTGGGIGFFGSNPSSATTIYGDASWANDVQWGTTNSAPYVETCYQSNVVARAFCDGFSGARAVVRYCKLINAELENHEGGSRTRASRSFEFYKNELDFTSSTVTPVYLRGGTGVIFSNTIGGAGGGWVTPENPLIIAVNYRTTDAFTPFGQANGTNNWDTNYVGAFDTGTYTGTNGSIYLLDTNKDWSATNWAKYSVVNLTSGRSGAVLSNTKTNITFITPAFVANYLIYWTNGDAYAIYKVKQALDQVGIGAGDLMQGGSISSGTNPVNVATGTVSYTRNAFDPVYFWGNSGMTESMYSGYPGIYDGLNFTNVARPGYTPLVYPYPNLGWTDSTNLALSANPSPSTNGVSVTFAATFQTNYVTATDATGTVTFWTNSPAGGTAFGTGSLSSGVATYSSSALPVGTWSIVATWPGSGGYLAITSGVLSQVVYSPATPPDPGGVAAVITGAIMTNVRVAP